jgi:hypothetical protein
MAYIGREPQIGNFQVCDAISVVNGQAAYTMQVGGANVSPETANHMIVSLNGIIQAPGTSYTVSGSTITFASNLATGDVINFIHILGSVLDLGTPSDGTVTNAKLAQDIISGETELAAVPADTDEFLVSDAGTLKRVDFSHIINGAAGTWTSTVTYSTTLTNTSGGDATTTVTGNYHKVGKVYYWSLPNLTRDSTFGGSDVIINKFTLPATANSNSVNSRGIVGGYKMQGRYNTSDLTSDGQVYWSISAGNDYATLVYLQLNSSGTGFVRLNGSGSSAKLAGYFIGA